MLGNIMVESQPTIFLDRDGVINYNSPDYIRSWADFGFIPGSTKAIAKLTKAGFRIIIITNQSAVGKGLMTKDALLEIFYNMDCIIKACGGKIDDIFFCPHTPEDKCDCRKPKPDLILRAAKKHNIDLGNAWMIGDKLSDILSAKAADCDHTILIGNRIMGIRMRGHHVEHPNAVCRDLLTATEFILTQTINK